MRSLYRYRMTAAASAAFSGQEDAVTMTVVTTSSPQTVTLTRITPTGADCVVTWGDGNSTTITDGETGSTAHEYTTAGTYQLTLSNFSFLTYFNVTGVNLSGDIGGVKLPESLVYLDISGTGLSGDIGRWELPDTLTYMSFNGSSVSGDIGNWELPSSLVELRLFAVSSISGDISGWVLPSSLDYFRVNGTDVSGDISGWVLPDSLTYLRVDTTNVSGDISGWVLPELFSRLYVSSTSLYGTPDVSANTELISYGYAGCSLPQANVDAVLLSIYNRRAAFTNASPALDLGAPNSTPSGIYQDGDPPTTGLEYVYELANDPESEGFNTWSITYNGGSAP